MPVKRANPDGLPFNLYERRGKRTYRIFFKSPAPPRPIVFSESCAIADRILVAKTRREAIQRAARINEAGPADGTFAALANAWLKMQEAKPIGSEGRRADTTLAENKREIAKLNTVLGHIVVRELTKVDGYDYLEEGERKRRPEKANKEIALAVTILEHGIRKGLLEENPFMGLKKNVTAKYDRHVTDAELELAVEVGRAAGGARHIVALGLKTAWLCVRRSVEVRDFQVHQITDAGIEWTGAKRKKGTVERVVLIEWTPELKATIDEARAVQRFTGAVGGWYIFGGMGGQKYTKGGWKKMLHNLMELCVAEAAKRGVPFQKFSLQDCRPKGVSDKMAQHDTDTQDATLHTSKKMIDGVYDRRRVRVARPVR